MEGNPLRLFVGLVALWLTSACAVPVDGGPKSGGPQSLDGSITKVADSTTPEAAAPADPAQAKACAHFVAAQYDACVDLPTAEKDRRRALYQNDCISRFSMPGSGATPPSLEACASAIDARHCNGPFQIPPSQWVPECDLRGTFDAGAPCFTPDQCASGDCQGTGGFVGNPTCGYCTRPFELGEVCPLGGCRKGAVCEPTSSPGAGICRAFIVGAAGDPCGNAVQVQRCAPGLYCAGGERCEPELDVGVACSRVGEPGCRFPAYCSSSDQCTAPGGLDDACEGDTCAAGLACTADSQLCKPVIWRKGGEPCDIGANRCIGTYCQTDAAGPTGTCPLIAGAGEKCGEGGPLCDAGLLCFEGRCVGAHAIECN